MDAIGENEGQAQAPRSPGAILAAERERQGLSRADIAQRLHMSVSQVEALESADYERLPRGTFLRGFTRNYARVVGLDGAALVELLSEDAPPSRSPGIVVPSQNIRFDPLGARLANPYVKAAGIAAVAIVLGFAAMYWWLFIRPQGVAAAGYAKKVAAESPRSPAVLSVPPPASGPPAELTPLATPAPNTDVAGLPPAPEPAPAAPLPVSASPAPVSVPAPAPTQAASPALPAPAAAVPAAKPAEPAPARRAEAEGAPAVPGGASIRLAFKAPAWVEITDSKGRVLLSRTHPAGSEAEVAGKPPFTLVIGNAPEVRLSYNGREVDLAPHTRVAVARLTLP